MVQTQRDDRQIRTIQATQLIDRGAARLEIRDHLRGDFLRIGVHALRTNAVIAGKDHRLRPVDALKGVSR